MRLRVVVWLCCLWVLAACNGEEESRLPTFTPDFSSPTPRPINTIAATRQVVTLLPETLEPSWTPLPSATQPPTRTPAPTLTPRPTITATQSPETPDHVLLEDGSIRVLVNAADLNTAFAPVEFSVAPDQMRVQLEVPNPFLNTTSTVDADLGIELTAQGLELSVLAYEVEGTQISQQEVEAALNSLELALSPYLIERYWDAVDAETEVEFLAFDLDWDVIAVTIRPR